jgi:hypothetical protein
LLGGIVKKIQSILTASAATLLVGCIPAGTYSYVAKGTPAAETALIRPANKQERQYKPSTAARIFGGPSGAAQITYFSPANDLKLGKVIRQYDSLRVSPGSYMVRALCVVGGFYNWFNLPINAKASKVYLLECVGSFARNVHVTTREIDAQ